MLLTTYSKVKEFLKLNERSVILVISFTCVFLLGFFTGKIDSYNKNQPIIKVEKSQLNSTILNQESQQGNVLGEKNEAGNCPVKGNISSSSKIYHLPGGSFYDRTNPEVCFNTAAEAEAAGFRKSQR